MLQLLTVVLAVILASLITLGQYLFVGSHSHPVGLYVLFAILLLATMYVLFQLIKIARKHEKVEDIRGQREQIALQKEHDSVENVNVCSSPKPPEPMLRLDINILDWEFGASGEGGYPHAKTPTARLLRIYIHFTASHRMLVETVTIELMARRIPSDWDSQLIIGSHQQYLYFEIPGSINKGQHHAQVFARADGREWPSLLFTIDVTQR